MNDGVENDCKSCKTKADWDAYYQQAENTAAMMGEDAWGYTNKRLTREMDEQGHSIFYLDGERMDLRQYSNRADAIGNLISDAALIEAGVGFLKYINSFFKSSNAAKGIDGLLKAGNATDKGGFTAVGRALQKHGSRTGSLFPKATGNVEAINAQGKAVLKEILTNPKVINTIRHHARFGKVLEYRIPGGQGVRFSSDGKKFIGLLE